MADLARMTVELPEALAALLREAVEVGDYASTGEAVRDAVRLWSEERERRAIERMRRAWDAGKASGHHGGLDLGELRQESRNRLDALRGGADRDR